MIRKITPLTHRILTKVSQYFSEQGYTDAYHQRLSIETDCASGFASEFISYQGLNRAVIPNTDISKIASDGLMMANVLNTSDMKPDDLPIMIKWSVRRLGTSQGEYPITTLEHEITQLQAINQQASKQCQSEILAGIAKARVVPLIKASNQTLTIDNQYWQLTTLVMPYFKDRSVKAYLAKRRQSASLIANLTLSQRLALLITMAETLAGLHELNWRHGDIKPSNFLLQSPKFDNSHDFLGTIYLCDMACAANMDETTSLSMPTNPSTSVKGTPAYLAPECWQGNVFGIQSDIYAFGITLYEVLIGQRPYNVTPDDGQDTYHAWAIEHCQTPIPLLSDSLKNDSIRDNSTMDMDIGIRDSVETKNLEGFGQLQPILDKLLAKRVENRYTTMQKVMQDLKEVQSSF